MTDMPCPAGSALRTAAPVVLLLAGLLAAGIGVWLGVTPVTAAGYGVGPLGDTVWMTHQCGSGWSPSTDPTLYCTGQTRPAGGWATLLVIAGLVALAGAVGWLGVRSRREITAN